MSILAGIVSSKVKTKLSCCLLGLTFLIVGCGAASPEAQVCNSYKNWNWYTYNKEQHSWESEEYINWENLEINEFGKLSQLSFKWSDDQIDSQLKAHLKDWIDISLSEDKSTGVVAAALLWVRCEDLGFDLPEETLN